MDGCRNLSYKINTKNMTVTIAFCNWIYNEQIVRKLFNTILFIWHADLKSNSDIGIYLFAIITKECKLISISG